MSKVDIGASIILLWVLALLVISLQIDTYKLRRKLERIEQVLTNETHRPHQ
jgi:cell division protein FtsL